MKSREQKKMEALKRQESYNQLTTKQKIAKLDAVLGKGIGATKQRKRLERN